MSTYRSGFVSIIGCPNVGKSTLLNQLVGQKIAIVSQRPQTTRNKITGVLTREAYQIIFLDTPGVAEPKNRLGNFMLKIAYDALNEVEAILFVLDPVQGMRDRDSALIERLKSARVPKVALMNKIDVASKGQLDQARAFLEQAQLFDQILAISAKDGDGLDELERILEGYLVEGPQYFPNTMVTDQPERVVCAELIREKALQLLKEEVPHGIGVSIERMSVRPDGALTDVWATIFCERESHKGILIGKGGSMLKKIGEAARKDMEWMLGTRVNLQLWIKVKEDWRNSQFMMRELGYE